MSPSAPFGLCPSLLTDGAFPMAGFQRRLPRRGGNCRWHRPGEQKMVFQCWPRQRSARHGNGVVLCAFCHRGRVASSRDSEFSGRGDRSVAGVALLWLIFLYAGFQSCASELITDSVLTLFYNCFWNLWQPNLRRLSERESGRGAVFGLPALLDSWRPHQCRRLLLNTSTAHPGNLPPSLLLEFLFSFVAASLALGSLRIAQRRARWERRGFCVAPAELPAMKGGGASQTFALMLLEPQGPIHACN